MTKAEYPVGTCRASACFYPEPHRHGFDCSPTCECEGIGAITSPLGEGDLQTCDWGYCNREAVALRVENGTVAAIPDDAESWLSVCAWHAGWLDSRPTEGATNG